MKYKIQYLPLDKKKVRNEIEFRFGWDNLDEHEGVLFTFLIEHGRVPESASEEDLEMLSMFDYIKLVKI